MFIKLTKLQLIIRKIALKVFNYIENNNDHRFNFNGEEVFIDLMLKEYYKNKNIIIFDIGANIGEYTKLMFNKSKDNNISSIIHCFEPTKYCFSILQTKFNNENNIYLNNFGLSNNENEAVIYSDVEGSGLNTLHKVSFEHYNVNLNNKETIKLKKMKDYIDEMKIKHIHYIKIDVEGHELKVFEGMGKYLHFDFIDFIQFEYNINNLESKVSLLDIYKIFEKNGFKIAKVLKTGIELRNYNHSMDNYMYANYVAISKNILHN